jgi:hypothetical protein
MKNPRKFPPKWMICLALMSLQKAEYDAISPDVSALRLEYRALLPGCGAEEALGA